MAMSCFGQGRFETSLGKAHAFYAKNYFEQAITYYKKCIRLDQQHVPSMVRLGMCYKKLNRSKEALRVFEYLHKNKLLHDTLVTLYVECFKKEGKLEKFPSLISAIPSGDSLRKKLTREYDSIKHWSKAPSRAKITNLKTINTNFSELAPVVYKKEGLVYLSNREGILIKKREESTGMPNYNIYLSRYNAADSSKFERKQLFSNEVNSLRQEAGVCFSAHYDQVFYSRAFREYDKTYRFKLYLSQKKRKTWGLLKEFAFNDSTASFIHPNLSPDGNLFFFSSDMQGGYGGKDIYVCVKIDSLWSEPINVGPTINTAKNEIFPVYTALGNLYFASDGHIGMGGYDLFKALQSDGDWVCIQNLKPPINTFDDELSICFSDVSEQKGYFSSNRPGGQGLEDLYQFEFK